MVRNIDDPCTARVLDMTGESVTAAEVPSSQLKTIMDSHPDVGTILSITPDHLDRRGTIENYICIKGCITLNQTKQNIAVLGYDNPILRGFSQDPEPRPRVI